ncbi:UbiA prenyltransferase [Kribbella flavida DSM 17836]|uniref:UbiA prenyltransferase n=1 Tax=Kribbella flavida (strain DSM 17836 / JCM 10339 / NBRC 14399) TaxID=479435 RepID=D2Q3S4_KRIFD|nr:UbiA family prenyltransferase [Kribbella flavida]ADB35946.1 UbiA prenyltransferase [Kribbella flavida DSM 17836]
MTTLVAVEARPRLRDVLAVGRPAFWIVSVVPYYVGILLATHRLVPPVELWPRLLVGAVVMGPLLWLAVLAINDAYDLPGDLLNPRKSASPLLDGRVSVRQAKQLAVGAGVAALLVACFVGWVFTAGVLLALVLGWAYSVPPVRLKTRAGFDVASNSLALGAFGPLAGWAAVTPELGGFPWVMALQGTLAAIGLYLPTTLADLPADRAAGYRTIAVRLGASTTYRLGYAAWIAAATLSVLLAALDMVIPRSMLALEIVMVPVLVAAYGRLIGPGQTFRQVITLATLFLIPCAAFALTYTGVL